MDDDKGASIVIVHSNKGVILMRAIMAQVNCKRVDVEKVLPKSADSRKSVQEHPNRKRFFAKLYKTADFSKLVEVVEPPKYVVLIQKVKSYIRKTMQQTTSQGV